MLIYQSTYINVYQTDILMLLCAVFLCYYVLVTLIHVFYTITFIFFASHVNAVTEIAIHLRKAFQQFFVQFLLDRICTFILSEQILKLLLNNHSFVTI